MVPSLEITKNHSLCFSLRFCQLKFQTVGFTVEKDKDCAKIHFFSGGRRKETSPAASDIRSASVSDMLLILCFCFFVDSAVSLGLFRVCRVGDGGFVRVSACG